MNDLRGATFAAGCFSLAAAFMSLLSWWFSMPHPAPAVASLVVAAFCFIRAYEHEETSIPPTRIWMAGKLMHFACWIGGEQFFQAVITASVRKRAADNLAASQIDDLFIEHAL